jgi:hypothetical protein
MGKLKDFGPVSADVEIESKMIRSGDERPKTGAITLPVVHQHELMRTSANR